MNELIKVNHNNPDRPTVSGRELHKALGIKTIYVNWFSRMCEYGFTEGVDYFPKTENRSDGLAGKPRIDHEISLDMAKEICMIQRSPEGKKFREYFIAVEKAWNDPVLIMGRAYEAQKAIADRLNEQVLNLETRIEADKPKVLFADAVETSHTSILIGDLAKLIKQNGVDMGQRRLFDWLRENGYLIKSGNSKNMPTQKSMDMKLFEVKERTINNPDGSVRITKTTKVTGKGQTYFINKFLGGAQPTEWPQGKCETMIFDLSRAAYAASVAYTAIAFNDKKILWWWLLIFFMEIPKMVMVKENRKE